MQFKKYSSIEKLVEAGREKAKDKSVVTFDLFDTLVIRRVHDPDLVKLPVARYIAAKAGQLGISISWQKVQQTRDEVEQQNRQETGAKFADYEAHYPTFMKRALEEIFQEQYSDELLENVTEHELFMENRMLVPREGLVAWLKELSAQGKRIVIISDIYLPSWHLKKLVEYAGILQYVEDVISSADTFLAKASGEAFPLAEKKFGFTKGQWLHIGDNPISDGLRPSEFGIEALVLNDASEKLRKSITRRYLDYSDGKPFWRGRALLQLMQPHEGENIEREPLYIEGYNFLGPMIGGFVQEIAERCKKKNITKVFFLAREGWTFKLFWEKCMPTLYPEGDIPEIEYLYVSRMALAGATCAYHGLTKENASIAFLPLGNRDFRDVCRIFSLDPEPFVPILARYNLQKDTCLSYHHEGFVNENHENFSAILYDDEFQSEVKRQTRPKSDAMIRYFTEAGLFDHEDVAIIDIGWLGTIQRFLFDAIKHHEKCPTLHGMLFAATRGMEFPESNKNRLEGLIFDRNKFNLAASSIMYARDLFEEACRAPHPTLNGYKLTEDGYELEFRRTDDEIGEAEKAQDNYFAPLQKGIQDAAEMYGSASALLGYKARDYKPWFNYMLSAKLAFPKASEVEMIRHQTHLDDFHGKHKPVKIYEKRQKTLWDESLFQLRFNPFIRMKYFFHNLKERIREQV